MTNNHVKLGLISAVVVIIAIGGIGYYSVENAKIQAEKEKKIAEVHEHEETERTEERSQFWQKAIPWGNDETEKGEATDTVPNQGE